MMVEEATAITATIILVDQGEIRRSCRRQRFPSTVVFRFGTELMIFLEIVDEPAFIE